MKGIPDRAEFDGSPVIQHEGEKIAYDCIYQTAPDSLTSVKIYDASGTDKSSTCLSGSASLSGTTVTTPLVQALTDDETYKVVVLISRDGNTLSNYFWIHGAA